MDRVILGYPFDWSKGDLLDIGMMDRRSNYRRFCFGIAPLDAVRTLLSGGGAPRKAQTRNGRSDVIHDISCYAKLEPLREGK